MSVPWQSARHGRGLLLLRGRADAAASWSRRGLVPVHVVPFPGWSAVVPAGPSVARPPYDDALVTLAGRPVAARLRGAIGLFAVRDMAVVTTQPSGWRATRRWLVWQPGAGVVRTPRLPAGRPEELVAVAGLRDRRAVRSVAELLRDPAGDAAGLLTDLLTLLDLPGAALVDGTGTAASVEGARLVEPAGHLVARFDSMVADDARLRAELEEH